MKQLGWWVSSALCVLLLVVGCSKNDPGPDDLRGGSDGADGDTGFGNADGDGNGDSLTGDFGNGDSASGGNAGGGSAGDRPIGMGCAGADVSTSRVVPTVLFVIDGSGSMDQNFNGPSRWEALRSSLMDPGGIVETLESSVEFGMVLYHGPSQGFLGLFGGGGPCPVIQITDPVISNFAVMSQAYPASPLGGSTPTHLALEFVMLNLADTDQVVLDENLGPQYVVLATDGRPNDNCEGGVGGDAMPQVVAAAQLGAAKGIKMFVISLSPTGGEPEFQAHLEEIAVIGDTGYPPFSPETKDELSNVLIQVIGGAIGCQVSLNGTVTPGSECQGYVEVNGNRLDCDSPNGWRLVDERTFELTGTECDDFLTDPESMLHADFPCDVFVPE